METLAIGLPVDTQVGYTLNYKSKFFTTKDRTLTMSEYTGGIPVELPVEAVRRYVQAEELTLERFDLLQNYFEGRIIKLLEEHVWQVEFNKRFFGPAWKQKCRCGHYGVFNDHLAALIKGETR